MTGFRVLHVTDYGAAYEGAFIRQLRMLDDEIRMRGGRSSALCVTDHAFMQSWIDTLASEYWLIRTVPESSTRSSRRVADAIRRAISDADPDVVHVHFGTYDLSTRRAVLSARKSIGTPDRPSLVWHYRTALETSVEQRGILRRIKDSIKFEHASRDVDLVVGVTQALADEAIARGVAAERARGIIAGCDTETFRPNETARARVRQELGLNEDDVLLLHMGWTWHRKGGDLLADAMAQVGESVEGRRIVAASIGVPAEVDMGAVRRLEMTDRVWEYHQASDIFISASRSEGFGNGLIEAMACGRVAVAASAEGQQETFGAAPGVQAVPVGDSSAIARAITQLMTQRDEWGILGAANREHVIQHHSMRRWARDMADAYAVLQPGAMLSIPTAGCEEALGA